MKRPYLTVRFLYLAEKEGLRPRKLRIVCPSQATECTHSAAWPFRIKPTALGFDAGLFGVKSFIQIK